MSTQASKTLKIELVQNADKSWTVLCNGAVVLRTVATKDLAEALAARFGWGAGKENKTGLGKAAGNEKTVPGDVRVEHDARTNKYMVVHTIGREQKRYVYSSKSQAESFANQLLAGTYPSSSMPREIVAANTVTAANEQLMVAGVVTPLRIFAEPSGH